MNDEINQEKSPKYKLGDDVWTPLFGVKCEKNEQYFVQCKISGVVYLYNADGKSVFEGYTTTGGNRGAVVSENGVFATREECEALIACVLPRPKSDKSEGK